MPRYKVLRALGWNGRHEPGEEVSMDESEAAGIGPSYLEPLEEEKPAESSSEAKPKKLRKKSDAEAS